MQLSGRARRRRRTIKAFQNSVPKGPPPEAGDRAPDVRLLDHRGGGGFLSQALRGKGAVLLFLPSAADPAGQAMLRAFAGAFPRLEAQINVFPVTAQPAARNAAAVGQLQLPFPLYSDPQGAVARAYGVAHNLAAQQPVFGLAAVSVFLIDKGGRLRLVARNSAAPKLAETVAAQREAQAAEAPQALRGTAPALLIPQVFEPAFCQELIAAYEAGEKQRTGTLRDLADGRREHYIDDKEKIRLDHHPEPALLAEMWRRLEHRVVPEIAKSFQFQATRHDNLKIGCYEGTTGGHFGVHRDNDSPGVAHRRFALTLNLNDGYEGGHLRFPEFGPHLYRPEAGEAIVFSCSLLHEALPVTRGTRFMVICFLFGEEDQAIRDRRVQGVETRHAGQP